MVHSALNAILDVIPPYRRVQGSLVDKEVATDGKCYIWVGAERVEVDRPTYDTLEVGEDLRIRTTRGRRAINVDRLLR